MDQIANPYRPGAGTPPPALIGRDDLIDRFGVTLRRTLSGRPGKGFLPTGLCGVGKTVLLNRFISIASAEGVKTAFIESPESGDFASLLAIRLRRILLEMSTGALKPAVSKALGALRSFTLQRITTQPDHGRRRQLGASGSRRNTRRELFSGPPEPPDTERERVLAGDGRTRPRTSPFRRHRRGSRGES